MDLYPELMYGNSSLSSLAFAMATADITAVAATNSTAEIFNPVTSTVLVTVTGLILDVGAASNVRVLKSASATDVNTAATAGPNFADFRGSATPTATFKQGTPATILGSLEVYRIGLGAASILQIPFNWDLPPGTGLNLVCDVQNTRLLASVIWIERTVTY